MSKVCNNLGQCQKMTASCQNRTASTGWLIFHQINMPTIKAMTQGRIPRGNWGDAPPNLMWGTAHASVPPIF